MQKQKLLKGTKGCLLALSVGIILFVLLIGILLYIQMTPTHISLLPNEDKPEIVVPIEIKDSTYYFLWDTGSTFSFMEYDLAVELGLVTNQEKVYKNLAAMHEMIADSFNIINSHFYLGDLWHSNHFYSNERDIYYELSPDLKEDIKGIIGQNIISRFNWLFDFTQNQALVSRKQIAFNRDSVNILNLPFETSRKTPYLNLKLNNAFEKEFYLDTGCRLVFPFDNLEDYKLYPSFVMHSDSINLSMIQNKTILFASGGGISYQFAEFDTICINNLELHNIAMMYRSQFLERNYITANFLFQFDKMYYNSTDNEIELIAPRRENNPLVPEKRIEDFIKGHINE